MKDEPIIKHYTSFIKVGDKQYMRKLLTEGEIYCRPIDYFTSIDYTDLRGDKYDGIAFIEQTQDIELFHDGKLFARAVSGQFYGRDLNKKGNIYCLYGIDTDSLNMEIGEIRPLNLDVSSLSFGDTVVLIYDPGEFIRRVEKAVKNAGYAIESSPVMYYDNQTRKGALTPFHKSNKYEGQKEFRFWIPNAQNGDLVFKIGDISTIAYLMQKEDLAKIKYKPI